MSETQVTGAPQTAIAKVEPTTIMRFDASDPSSLYMQPALFDQLQRVAKLIAASGSIPDHLKGNVSDCFLVAGQALRWRMDPFAVAQSCYVLKGKLGYEGKLIAAVVNASPALKTKLNYEYSGKGQERTVRVFGTLKGETEPREVVGTVAAWKTTNQQWTTQVDQMLSYRGAREWARRHMPETILGVYAEEELPQVVQPETVVVEPASLSDVVGEVVEAANDPKAVEAEIVPPQKKAKEKAKPEPVPVQKAELSPEDAELDSLFKG